MYIGKRSIKEKWIPRHQFRQRWQVGFCEDNNVKCSVLFVLDTSGSIGQQTFQKMTNALSTLTPFFSAHQYSLHWWRLVPEDGWNFASTVLTIPWLVGMLQDKLLQIQYIMVDQPTLARQPGVHAMNWLTCKSVGCFHPVASMLSLSLMDNLMGLSTFVKKWSVYMTTKKWILYLWISFWVYGIAIAICMHLSMYVGSHCR